MFKAILRRKWLATAVVAASAIVCASLGAVAYASIPDFGGVIHGCYKSDKGDRRVIDPAASRKDFKSWKNDETPLDWNQEGVQGPTGPQGPQGRKVPRGPVTRMSRPARPRSTRH
jgi:hypothetical protein